MQTVAKFVEKCRDVVVCQKRRFVADGVREVTDEEGDGRAYRTVGQYAVDLDIYENEFVTLLGPSGCGKTTLLRILGGFLQADQGEVLFDGQEISKLPPYKREINTVFQKYALFPHMNVYDNIAFGLKLKKV